MAGKPVQPIRDPPPMPLSEHFKAFTKQLEGSKFRCLLYDEAAAEETECHDPTEGHH